VQGGKIEGKHFINEWDHKRLGHKNRKEDKETL